MDPVFGVQPAEEFDFDSTVEPEEKKSGLLPPEQIPTANETPDISFIERTTTQEDRSEKRDNIKADEVTYNDQVDQATTNLDATKGKDPFQVRKAINLAYETKQPTSGILDSTDFLPEQSANLEMPATRKLLSSPFDGPGYGGYEQYLSTYEKVVRSTQQSWTSGWENNELGHLTYQREHGGLTPEQTSRLAEIKLNQMTGPRRNYDLGFVTGAPAALAESLPFMIDDFVAGIDEAAWGAASFMGTAAGLTWWTGGGMAISLPAAGVSGFSSGMMLGRFDNASEVHFGLTYDELSGLRDEYGNFMDPEMVRGLSKIVGVLNGALDTAGEQAVSVLIPGLKDLKMLPKETLKQALMTPTGREMLWKFLKRTGIATGGEITTEVIQEFNAIVAGYAGFQGTPGGQMSLDTAFEGATERLGEAAYKAAQATLLLGAVSAPINASGDYRKIREANRRVEQELKKHEAAKDNPLVNDNPEAYKSAMVYMQDEYGIDDAVYIDKAKLQEFFEAADVSNEQIAASMPEVARQLADPESDATEIIVPYAQYETYIVPAENFPNLAHEIRHDVDGVTSKEAQESMKHLQDLMEALDDEKAQDEHPAYTQIRKMLIDKAGMSEEMADMNARLIGAMYSQMAEKTGQSVEELWEQHRVSVNNSEIAQQEEVRKFTHTDNFKTWFQDSKVLDEDGNPRVVYHGALVDFDQFDQEYSSIMGDLGAGFYFSTAASDVEGNYSTTQGADRKNQIATRAEEIMYDPDLETDGPGIDYQEALRMAEEEMGPDMQTLPVMLSIQNPVVMANTGGTTFEIEVEYEKDDTDLEFPDETGTGVELALALDRLLGDQFDHDGDLANTIYGIMQEGDVMTANDIYNAIKNAGVYDNETGAPASGELFRLLMQEMGFDGIEDQTVATKFNMGIPLGTSHFIAFEPTQIKGIFNNGEYSLTDPRILFQRAAYEQFVPNPDNSYLNLPYGRVEQEMHELWNHPTKKLSVANLKKIFGAPMPRKDKAKLDKNVKPVAYDEIKKMLEWGIENQGEGAQDWYHKFGAGAAALVGLENMQEFSILFGITSAQKSPEANLSETLNIMRLARINNPVTDEAKFRASMRHKGLDGKGMGITGQSIDSIVEMYKTGTFSSSSGIKISNYMQTILAKAYNQFTPFTVMDVHMSRVFGYRYREYSKSDSKVMLDKSQYRNPAQERYSQYITTQLARDYHMRPDEVQAALWFYAKENLSPQGSKTEGTFDSAREYADIHWKAIEQQIADGTFDTTKPLLPTLVDPEPPKYRSGVVSDAWTNIDLNNAILARALATGSRVIVSANPGNARGFGFPEDVTLDQLKEYNDAVMAAITDDSGQIKVLRRMGIPHKIVPILGTFDRVEPSWQIQLPGASMQQADQVAKLLGDAMLQDAAITAKPDFEGEPFGIVARKPDGLQFTEDEVLALFEKVNPGKDPYGLNFSVTTDGTGLRFLDGAYYDEETGFDNYTKDQIKLFANNLRVTLGETYDFSSYAQTGDYHEFNERTESSGVSGSWDQTGLTGRPDLQRAAISDLYEPIWSEYEKWVSKNGYQKTDKDAPQKTLEVEKRLEQATGKKGDPHGYIEFPEDRSYFNITLTGKANASTFIHESGHFALEMYRVLAPNNPEIAQDLAIIEQHLGVEPGAEFTVEQHEKFARSFEAYLYEGKAPSEELRSTFQRLKSLMALVYRTITQLNVDLDNDIREVFDRMIASEKQIEETAQLNELGALFETLEEAEAFGMSKEQYDAYRKDVNASLAEADDTLRTSMMKAVVAATRKEYRGAAKTYTEEIAKDVAQRPVQIARSVLLTGKMPDGTEVADAPKLNRSVIMKNYPKGTLPKLRGMVEEGGEHPDIVAMDFGFDSGEQMLEALANSKPAGATVRAEVNAKLKKEFGDIKNPEVLAQQATDAMHNDKVSRFLLAELKALKPQGVNVKAIRATVEALIRETPVGQLRPDLYQQAETRFARLAREAVAKKSFDEAFDARRNQLINHWKYREAAKAKKQAEKTRKFLKRFGDVKLRKRIGKINPDYLAAIDALLDNTSFNVQKAQDAEAKMIPIETRLLGLEEAGAILVVAPELRTATPKHWKEMTPAELQALHDATKNLEHLARAAGKVQKEGKAMSFEALKEQMIETIEESGESMPKRERVGALTKWETMKHWMRMADAQLSKMEFMARWLDGGKVSGFISDVIFQPFVDAQAAELDMMADLGKHIAEPLTRLIDDKEQAARMQQKVMVGSLTTTMEGLYAMALNMGNAQNVTKMLKGFETLGVNEQAIKAAIDKHMTKDDWVMVQQIWDRVNLLWEPIADLQERQTGIRPEKVEAVPVNTPHGTFSGGYYPLVYDRNESYRAEQLAQKKGDMFENNHMRAWVEQGFAQSRTEFYAPIELSVGKVLFGHIQETIHYITHYEAVTEVDRIIQDPEVRQAIVQALGSEKYQMFNPWLQALANGKANADATTVWESIVAWSRHGLSVVAMGFKFSTAMMQGLGMFTTMKELGFKQTAKGLDYVIRNPKEAWEFATEHSGEFRHAMNTFDRDAREVLTNLSKQNGFLGWKGFQKYAFTMIGAAQKTVNMVSFHAAYQEKMDSGSTHEAAVNYAESIVRQSQSGGGMKDLAGVQRGGPMFQMLVMFYTFFSVLYNQLQLAGHDVVKGKSKIQFAVDMSYLIFLPVLVEGIFKGKVPDEDDDEAFLEWWLKESLLYGVTSVPFVRDIANGAMSEYGYSATPMQSIGEKTIRAFGAIDDLATGEVSASQVRAISDTVGIALHLPTGQAFKTGEALMNLDKLTNPFQVITGVPKDDN